VGHELPATAPQLRRHPPHPLRVARLRPPPPRRGQDGARTERRSRQTGEEEFVDAPSQAGRAETVGAAAPSDTTEGGHEGLDASQKPPPDEGGLRSRLRKLGLAKVVVALFVIAAIVTALVTMVLIGALTD
jgi:hypothetical protein